jgi:hypothetical protein
LAERCYGFQWKINQLPAKHLAFAAGLPIVPKSFSY